MPTRSSISMDSIFASALGHATVQRNCSTIWRPMVIAGAKLAIGSWKIIETVAPDLPKRLRTLQAENVDLLAVRAKDVIRLRSPYRAFRR
jgi:hypothetical protein